MLAHAASRRHDGQLSVAGVLSEAVANLTAHGIANPQLDAEVLLARALGTNRAGLYTRFHDLLSAETFASFRRLIERRTRREPLQYITGIQEFWSLEFEVDQRVLIPRPETEVVVETVLAISCQLPVQSPKSPTPGPWPLAPVFQSTIRLPPPSGGNPQSTITMLDLGTGSGCIAIALATELPHTHIWATDVSHEALALAGENARRHGVAERVRFFPGDGFASVAESAKNFDVIVSNPPYIIRSELQALQPEVRDWEPLQALDGGADGLDFYRRLLSEGPAFLRPGGWLVMEIGHGQAAEVLRLVQSQEDLTAGNCILDYAGKERVMVTRKKSDSLRK